MQAISGGSWDEFMREVQAFAEVHGVPMTHVQHHLMGLRLRHATACSSRTPSFSKMSAVLSVPSTSLSVSSSFGTPVGRLPPVRPRYVRRVQVPSGPQSGVLAAEVRLRQFWLRRLDELRVRTLAYYELPPLLLPHSQEGLGAGSWRTLRTLVKRAEAAESWMGDKRLFPDYHRQDCALLGFSEPTCYRLRLVIRVQQFVFTLSSVSGGTFAAT